MVLLLLLFMAVSVEVVVFFSLVGVLLLFYFFGHPFLSSSAGLVSLCQVLSYRENNLEHFLLPHELILSFLFLSAIDISRYFLLLFQEQISIPDCSWHLLLPSS